MKHLPDITIKNFSYQASLITAMQKIAHQKTARREVIYQETVCIDGRTYVLLSLNYTDSINEQIRDEVIEDENQAIIDSVVDDIVNNIFP